MELLQLLVMVLVSQTGALILLALVIIALMWHLHQLPLPDQLQLRELIVPTKESPVIPEPVVLALE